MGADNPASPLTLDITRDCPWPDWASDGVIRRAAGAVAADMATAGHVDVLLTDDAAIRALNRDWRDLDKPTNVLSFPLDSALPGEETHLGDVVLALETVTREARDLAIPPDHHLCHLIVHGILHLLGYDHHLDAEATEMERLETRLLAGLGIADPHADPPVENHQISRHADA